MGAGPLKRGAVNPLSRKKGVPANIIIPKCTDRVFLRYRFGKNREIPTEYQPKKPNRNNVAQIHKNPLYIECTRYSCNTSLIYLKVRSGPQTQFDHCLQCFTRHRRPQDERIFLSYGSCVFQPCMRTGWVLETSPSNHYWPNYEVGQWLVFRWFGGWGKAEAR